jgi:hypothetical protein
LEFFTASSLGYIMEPHFSQLSIVVLDADFGAAIYEITQ